MDTSLIVVLATVAVSFALLVYALVHEPVPCPLCGAAITTRNKETHLGWHRSHGDVKTYGQADDWTPLFLWAGKAGDTSGLLASLMSAASKPSPGVAATEPHPTSLAVVPQSRWQDDFMPELPTPTTNPTVRNGAA